MRTRNEDIMSKAQDEEGAEVEVYEGEPDSVDRAVGGVQDDMSGDEDA